MPTSRQAKSPMDNTTADIVTNDQISHADQYKPLIVGYNNGAAIRLSDVADVSDGAQNIRTAGYLNGTPSITIMIFRQPGANIIDTVDRVRNELPSIEASIPQGIKTTIVLDRTTTIRASVSDVERTLILSVVLVILVVFIFLRNWRATLIPTVAVPASLIGTFAVMYLFGFSIDNLSLMALTISTGFVVDDAIVVMENISRLREAGMPPMKAAFQGSSEIGFTILSISMSLIAVFIPILFMAGIVGRLFREFAITLSTAIVVSMVISLTTTPMMCAYLLKDERAVKHGRAYRISERGFTWMHLHVQPLPDLGAEASRAGADPPAAHHCVELLSHRHYPQGVLPPAGYGSHHRQRAGDRRTHRLR